MRAFVCVDDNYGMLFNHRRCSRDVKVIEYIMKVFEGERVWVNTFSQDLFLGYDDKIRVSNDFLELAEGEDICFVENEDLSSYIDKITTLFVCKWNRKYPSDFKAKVQPTEVDWVLKSSVDFVGKSHDKITIEEWVKL